MGQAAAKQTLVIPELKDVTLEGVVPLKKELGNGAYGSVFTVKHGDHVYAAKRIHPILIESVNVEEKQRIKDDFIRECLCCSSIQHPNIVQFKGVYFQPEQSSLPIMVMELMHTSLTKLIDNNKSKISFGKKVSILHDVTLALSFLHNHKPQILHRDLSPNNIMLTTELVAKIGDLGVAKVVRAGSKETTSKLKLTRAVPGTPDFMPPEVMSVDSIYGTPIDVFSFGGITLFVFSEEWPTPSDPKMRDPVTKKLVALSEAERRQQYFDKMIGKAIALRKMVEQCLDDDPDERPPIQEVSAIIEPLKESPSFVEALQNDSYHIKWTSCSDLPFKLYEASVAVSSAGDLVYVTAGTAPDDNTYNNVFCYNTNTDHWTVLPQPGHRFGVLHMLDGRLTIFGGSDPVTHEYHNKVTTYNNDTNSWYSHYPDMLNKRFKPGITIYNDYVIVMGGHSSSDNIHDSIELMDYHNETKWKNISLKLPIPMCNIKPIISGDDITIVGYGTATGQSNIHYQIAIEEMISSFNQSPSTSTTSNLWKKKSPAPHYNTVTVPYTYPPVIIGGDVKGVLTSDVSLYDLSKNAWKKVDSLTSARHNVGVALLNNGSIIVIGGCTDGSGVEGAKAHSLTTVEIGNMVHNN